MSDEIDSGEATEPQDTREQAPGPGGAPKGNMNALKHGAYSKRVVKQARDHHKRKAQKEAQAILKAAGMQSDPLAVMVGRQIARLEATAARLEQHHEQRGYFSAKGELKSSVTKMVDVVDRLLGEARHMLEKLTLVRPEHGVNAMTDLILRSYGGEGSPPPRKRGKRKATTPPKPIAVPEPAESPDEIDPHDGEGPADLDSCSTATERVTEKRTEKRTDADSNVQTQTDTNTKDRKARVRTALGRAIARDEQGKTAGPTRSGQHPALRWRNGDDDQ